MNIAAGLSVHWIARAIGAALVIAALAKVMTPGETFASLKFVGERAGIAHASNAARWGVSMLVGMEFCLGVVLMLRPLRAVCICALGVLLLFAAYGLALIAMRAPVGCGCGVAIRIPGVDDRWLSVLRAGAMALAIVPCCVRKVPASE